MLDIDSTRGGGVWGCTIFRLWGCGEDGLVVGGVGKQEETWLGWSNVSGWWGEMIGGGPER